ncbi:galactose-1-phosphate uridylyltransferase [Chloroflexota bacterium]
MSELRRDPTTREWVILAPERAKRPQETPSKIKVAEIPDWDASCPFCPGNEAKTPHEVHRFPSSGEDSAWEVRVVPNLFAALSMEEDATMRADGEFAIKRGGFGAHEVIIESPSHNTPMALMSYQHVEKVLTAYQQRYNALKQNKQFNFITIFKNHGQASGTSLIHPHSQLVATPIMTPYYHRRFDVAQDYYADSSKCLYCDLIADELAKGERILGDTGQFVVFHPYASRVAYETWIIPKEHCSSFGLFSLTHFTELAKVLKDTLYCLHQHLDNPAFNLMVDTTITHDEEDPFYHWHIRILPRLSLIAGFEIGSGIYISTALPEDTARAMKEYAIALPGNACLTFKPES